MTQLRRDENVYQDQSSGAWYAEVLDYPGDQDAKWVKIGGAHDSRRAAVITLVAARIND